MRLHDGTPAALYLRMVALSEGKRILVVDDDADTRDTVADLLGLLGHECITAATAEEALEAFEAFGPNVVFVDIGLPDMSGHQLAQVIRAKYGAAVPIIAVSGRSQPSDLARSRECGIDLHMVKPVGYDALRNVVGKAEVKLAAGEVRRRGRHQLAVRHR